MQYQRSKCRATFRLAVSHRISLDILGHIQGRLYPVVVRVGYVDEEGSAMIRLGLLSELRECLIEAAVLRRYIV